MSTIIGPQGMRAAARRRLPAPIFDYLECGADDQWTHRANLGAWDRVSLQPRVLRDVEEVDTRSRLLNRVISFPLVLSPTGMNRLFHPGKELAVAAAAQDAGVMAGLSTMASTSLEDVAAVGAGPRFFQLYVFKDRGLTRAIVDRCRAASYDGLCITVDTPMAGNRERVREWGFTIPPKLTPRSALAFAARPGWVLDYLRDPDFGLPNIKGYAPDLSQSDLLSYIDAQFDRSLTWSDLEWLAGLWDGPLMIKGVTHPDDAKQSMRCGATALAVSNHGGRQLDGQRSALENLMAIRQAVGEGLEIVLDGGVRRPTHLLKALALGADACSVGRPYLYALAVGGTAGVRAYLKDFADELRRAMVLIGARSLAEVRGQGAEWLARPAWPADAIGSG